MIHHLADIGATQMNNQEELNRQVKELVKSIKEAGMTEEEAAELMLKRAEEEIPGFREWLKEKGGIKYMIDEGFLDPPEVKGKPNDS